MKALDRCHHTTESGLPLPSDVIDVIIGPMAALKFKVLLVFLLLVNLGGISSSLFLQNKLKKLEQDLKKSSENFTNVSANLELCEQDRGKIINTYKIPYSSSEFLISSELFEGKELTVNEWMYKGFLIKEIFLTMEQQDPEPIIVKVWDYQAIKKRGLDVNPNYRVIFNYPHGQAIKISTVPIEDKPEYIFSYLLPSGKQKISMIRNDLGELSYLKQISSSHQIYIQIIDTKMQSQWCFYNDCSFAKSTERIESIAKQIVF